MTQRPLPQTDETLSPRIDAEVLLESVSDQLATLHQISMDLERTLSKTLPEREELSDTSIHTIQRVDYLRQSLADLREIADQISGRMDWKEDSDMRVDCLKAIVKLQDSLPSSILPDTAPSDQQDIWL